MANQDNSFTNSGVELGAPTLIINPPAQPEEKAEQAKEESETDVAAYQDEGKS